MLEEAKKIYQQTADLYAKNWRNFNKNQLVLLALENKDNETYDGYISAIVLKYWNKMMKYYYKCRLVISPEDAHTWLVQAVMYAIEHHPWTDENSSIYNDKNGPDKVINRVMESKRLTFYQQLNRYNRKINSAILSLDVLTEEYLDSVTPTHYDEYDAYVDEFILKYYKDKEYFYAFMLDAIVYVGVSPEYPDHKKLVTYLKNLNASDVLRFCRRYGLEKSNVERAITYVNRLSRTKLKNKVNNSLSELKRRVGGYFNAN